MMGDAKQKILLSFFICFFIFACANSLEIAPQVNYKRNIYFKLRFGAVNLLNTYLKLNICVLGSL